MLMAKTHHFDSFLTALQQNKISKSGGRTTHCNLIGSSTADWYLVQLKKKQVPVALTRVCPSPNQCSKETLGKSLRWQLELDRLISQDASLSQTSMPRRPEVYLCSSQLNFCQRDLLGTPRIATYWRKKEIKWKLVQIGPMLWHHGHLELSNCWDCFWSCWWFGMCANLDWLH